MFLLKTTLFLILQIVINVSSTPEIKNLIGEPDYKKVRLHWETNRIKPDVFQIRYCELQTWGAQRCRVKTVDNASSNDIAEDDVTVYTTDVEGLRMATTYSFEVKLREQREDRAKTNYRNPNVIVIPTKGFSARATQCLPHASDIEVSTGPYFGGRIAVEAADGERCAIDGIPHSPRETYTLRIDHLKCGSRVNETTVATFVLVQENLPILTHSTRRFLVLCTYQPETLTVRAGISLPSNKGKNYKKDERRGRLMREDNEDKTNARTPRELTQPEALVQLERTEKNEALTVLLLLFMSAILMLSLYYYKSFKKKRNESDEINTQN